MSKKAIGAPTDEKESERSAMGAGKPLRVLILEDRAADTKLVVRELQRAGFAPDWKRVDTEDDYLANLDAAIDVILADYNMPDFTAPRALELLRQRDLDVPFIIVSGSIGEDTAVAAMQQGADDYLLKDRLERLGTAVSRALEQRRLRGERREAEQKLRDQARLINLAQDAIIVRDFDNGKVVFWNKGAERLYGWTADEAVTRDLGELIYRDPAESAAMPADLARTGEWRGELKQVTKDGRDVIVSGRTTLVRDESGRPKSVLIINTDITEQKKLEAQFLHAQRLEGIGTLASGVAHDLNNILAPILMSIPVLEPAVAGTRFESLLSTIGECAERGAGIVKQVLTFARGVEGKRMLVHVHHLLRDMEKVARQTFPRSITVQNMAPEDLWPVNGDATQLHQVLLNLCVNARDAMPEGGTLTFDAANLQIDENYAAMSSEARPGPYLTISISDTGQGIPSEIRQKIFDPFFTTKEIGKGTGLGLSTVIGIVRSHGGFLTVESQPEKGSTFKVFLPAQPEAAPVSQVTPEEKAPTGNGELILVVDDESSIRSIAQAVLQARGYRVLLAADGTDALGVFAQHSKDIAAVVTDIAMPFMDGAALIRALRRMKPGLPVIVSTGHGEQALVSDLQINAFLNKPYDADTLLRALNSALANPSA